MTELNWKQQVLLEEALRRYWLFHPDEQLDEAWTGLGYKSDYKPVVDAGLMAPIGPDVPRGLRWFKLTQAGAAIVQRWVDEKKYKIQDYELVRTQ